MCIQPKRLFIPLAAQCFEHMETMAALCLTLWTQVILTSICDGCLTDRMDRAYKGVNEEYRAKLDANKAEMEKELIQHRT